MRQGRSSYTRDHGDRFDHRLHADWSSYGEDSFEQVYSKPRRKTSAPRDLAWQDDEPRRRRQERRHRDDAYFEPGGEGRRSGRRERPAAR